MTPIEITLLIICAILSILLSISVYFNIKHGLLIINLVESIENSLDILDERYNSISKVLDIPIFYDSPQVKQVVEDIKNCRDSLLKTANELVEVQKE